MADASPFPSGAWRGFYVYVPDGARHSMSLRLTFRDGVVSGAGDDDIGPFAIKGRYDPQSHDIHWTKQYIGRHSVFYKGFGEPARIWGTWEFDDNFGPFTGGFRIWPGDGDGSLERAASRERETGNRMLRSIHCCAS